MSWDIREDGEIWDKLQANITKILIKKYPIEKIKIIKWMMKGSK